MKVTVLLIQVASILLESRPLYIDLQSQKKKTLPRTQTEQADGLRVFCDCDASSTQPRWPKPNSFLLQNLTLENCGLLKRADVPALVQCQCHMGKVSRLFLLLVGQQKLWNQVWCLLWKPSSKNVTFQHFLVHKLVHYLKSMENVYIGCIV